MTRVNLETAPQEVQTFVTNLPTDPNGVELALHGEVLWRLVPSGELTEAETKALLDRGREFVRDVRDRVKNTPSSVIKRRINEAVEEVRRRQG